MKHTSLELSWFNLQRMYEEYQQGKEQERYHDIWDAISGLGSELTQEAERMKEKWQ